MHTGERGALVRKLQVAECLRGTYEGFGKRNKWFTAEVGLH